MVTRRLLNWFVPESVTRSQLVLLWLTSLFVTCLIIANLTGSLLFSFSVMGTTALLSAGIIPFPVTFLLTDLLNEFYGARAARFVTLVGFVMSVAVFGFLVADERLPVDARSLLSAGEFGHFSGLYTGMIVASLSAYLVGQLLDIQVFHLFRKWTKHRLLWVRAQGSTIISQLFDSIIVSFVAFWGDLDAGSIWHLALSNYVWKFLIVVAITPLLYLGHALLRRLIREREELTERLEPEYQS